MSDADAKLGATITASPPDEHTLAEAFSIIESVPEIEVVIEKLRDLLTVDHLFTTRPSLGRARLSTPTFV